MSMTRRAFCGDPRRYFALALASMMIIESLPHRSSAHCSLMKQCLNGPTNKSLLRCRRCRRRDLGGLLSLRSRVAPERARRRKLAQLVSDHVLSHVDRNVPFAVVHAERQP